MTTLRNIVRSTARNRKRILLSLGVVTVVALWALGTGAAFGGKPVSNPVTVTFRTGQEGTDGVHGDGLGAYDNGNIGNGYLDLTWGSGGREVFYNLYQGNVYFGDPVNCPAGQTTGLFHGGGNLRVNPDNLAFLAMTVGTSQSGYATYNISVGRTNYLLRFRSVDDLNVQPAQNCSTQVTITRTATDTWVVEADTADIARLLINGTKGPGFTGLGHYQPVFMLTVKLK
jgi:hypothetical protein